MTAFELVVLSDEISQDFGRACVVPAGQFGMRWIELRTLWEKNSVALDSNEIAEALRLIQK